MNIFQRISSLSQNNIKRTSIHGTYSFLFDEDRCHWDHRFGIWNLQTPAMDINRWHLSSFRTNCWNYIIWLRCIVDRMKIQADRNTNSPRITASSEDFTPILTRLGSILYSGGMLKPMLVKKIFKPEIWLAGSRVASQSEAMLEIRVTLHVI